MAQWRAAEAALVEIRRQELAGLSEQDSAELFNRCAMPAGDFWLSPERLQSSGLVAQQKYFMRSRSHASCR
ncbi:MAG: hypothetical protein SFU53_01620 [Terrimicrobiaceae bacterium]|nr:hypothetical protein [Terrimicrobiaceae bacterium]